jgi:hypothetical protein
MSFATPSYPAGSVVKVWNVLRFHQSQQMKNNGNKKILPKMIVVIQQQRLNVCMIDPVMLILKDLIYF